MPESDHVLIGPRLPLPVPPTPPPATFPTVSHTTHGGRWCYVPTNELTALMKVVKEAEDAVKVAEALGLHLNPLGAALDDWQTAHEKGGAR